MAQTFQGPPLLMAHGGPAFGHNYMLPLKQQAGFVELPGRRVVGSRISDLPRMIRVQGSQVQLDLNGGKLGGDSW